MKHIKTFETKNFFMFEIGDLVRFKKPKKKDKNKIYYIDGVDIEGVLNFGEKRYVLLFPYPPNKDEEIGIGWFSDSEIKKLSDEEVATLKYNI